MLSIPLVAFATIAVGYIVGCIALLVLELTSLNL